eukprot:2110387-Amphidinium_carterae.1
MLPANAGSRCQGNERLSCLRISLTVCEESANSLSEPADLLKLHKVALSAPDATLTCAID